MLVMYYLLLKHRYLLFGLLLVYKVNNILSQCYIYKSIVSTQYTSCIHVGVFNLCFYITIVVCNLKCPKYFGYLIRF